MHSCSDYNDQSKLDGFDCLDMIEATDLVFLGEGQNGVVLYLNNDLAVKITYAGDYMHEMQIGCQLERLRPMTQAFVHLKGWNRCKGIPPSWLRYLPRYDQNHELIDWGKYEDKPLLYLFMERGLYRIRLQKGLSPSAGNGVVFWEDVSPDDAKKLLLILLHGLYIARKELQFSHNDIHDGQIMLFRRNTTSHIYLCGGLLKITDLPVIPKFVDYGASVVGPGNSFSDDVAQLGRTFRNIHPDFFEEFTESDAFEDAAGSSRDNFEVIHRLMESDFFAEFFHNRREDARLCQACMGLATHIIPKTRVYVCPNKSCVRKLTLKI